MDNIETNDQKQNNQQKQGENSQKQIAGAIILAAVIIGGAILLKGNRPSATALAPIARNGTNVENIELKPISKEDHIKGDARAKIIIVEYSDLECPFCKVFHKTMNQVIEADKNVAWVYRHFPLDCVDIPDPACQTLHQKARPEAEASECVWEQGGNDVFWKYIDTIFQITTSNDGLDPTELTKIAESLGLDMQKFKICTESKTYKTKISDQAKSGRDAGVRGTPKGFILKNGKVVNTIDGAQPFEAVKVKIEEALR